MQKKTPMNHSIETSTIVKNDRACVEEPKYENPKGKQTISGWHLKQ